MCFLQIYLHMSFFFRTFAAILGYCVSVRQNQNGKENKTMARPIAETPILYGEDALRFMQRMHNVQKISQEERERQRKAYEWMRSISTFPI